MNRIALVIATICTVCFIGGQLYAAESVKVRGGLHKEFGRLVFDWKGPVRHQARIEGGRLLVTFSRPLAPKFDRSLGTIRRYLGGFDLGPDGKTIIAKTKIPGLTPKAFSAGNRAIVDLRRGDESAQRDPPAKKKSAAAKPGPKKSKAETMRAQVSGALPVRSVRKKDYGRLIFDWPRKTGFSVTRNPREVVLSFSRSAKIDLPSLKAGLPAQFKNVSRKPGGSGLRLAFKISPNAQLRYFHNKSAVVFDVVERIKADQTRRVVKRPPSGKKPPAVKKTAAKKPAAAPVKSDAPPPPRFISVDASWANGRAVFRFNWRNPVGGAVYRQGDRVEIVFDRRARIDIGAIRTVARGLFRDSQTSIQDSGTVIRIPVSGGARTAVSRDGTIWSVAVGPEERGAEKSIPLRVRKEPDGGRALFIRTRNAGGILPLVSPETGQGYYAATLRGAPEGVLEERKFAEFALKKSPHGIALVAFDERIRMRRDPNGFVVFRPGGLNISAANKALARREKTESGHLLDFSRWKKGPAEKFPESRNALMGNVVQKRPRDRNDARLALARFYMAHDLAPEALGVISAMLRDAPARINDRRVRALRGVARFMMGHLSEARNDLTHASLAGSREIYPWRAAIHASAGNWKKAAELFTGTDAEIGRYPPLFAVSLGLLAAEAALSVKDVPLAEKRLTVIGFLPKSRRQENHAGFLKGHLLKNQGKTDKALALWKALAAQGDRPSRARAAFAIVNTQLEAGKIENAKAIDELERLKFAWRNSVFEFDLLQTLGGLYASNKDLRQALVTLRQAATLYRDIKGAADLTARMRKMFREFYLGGEADNLKPVVALGLFNEFRELTPPGDEGDKMIRRLAERLVRVDLLEQAASLLVHQTEFRLKGEPKAEVGARVAEIYLLDGKPKLAVDILRKSVVLAVKPALNKRRKLLEATALVEAGEYRRADQVIGRDYSRSADRLRAQLNWKAGRWRKAARILARLTGAFKPESLTDDQAEMLLRRAVALGLSGDEAGMEFLRERYGAAMEKSTHSAAFRAVAGGKLRTATDFAELARQAAEIDTFNAFMKTLGARKPAQTAALN